MMQNIFSQPLFSTASNYPGYHGAHNGGWDQRHPAFAYQTPPVPPSNHSKNTGQLAFQNRRMASGNTRNMPPPNACPFPASSSSCPSQGTTNFSTGPGHQLSLRNQFLASRDVSYASLPANFQKTMCTALQTPMRSDVCATRESLSYHNYNISEETMHSSVPDNAHQLSTSPSHGNHAVKHLQKWLIQRQSTGRQCYIPAAQGAGAYFSTQGSTPAAQGAGPHSSTQYSVPAGSGAYSSTQHSIPTAQAAGLYSSTQYSIPAGSEAYSSTQHSSPTAQGAGPYSSTQYSIPAGSGAYSSMQHSIPTAQGAGPYSSTQYSIPAGSEAFSSIQHSIPVVQGAGTYSSSQASMAAGAGVHSATWRSNPAVQDAGAYSTQFSPCRSQGNVNADRGVRNNGPVAVGTGRTESLNLPSAVMVGPKCGRRREERDLGLVMDDERGVTSNCRKDLRLKPNFEVQGRVPRTVCGGQQPPMRTSSSTVPTAVPAQKTDPHPQPLQPVNDTVSWSSGFKNSLKEIEALNGTLRQLLLATESISNTELPLVPAPCGEKEVQPQSCLNPSGSSGSRSGEITMNQCGPATAQESYQCVPSQAAACPSPLQHAFPAKQRELLSTSAQLPIAQDPEGRITRGTSTTRTNNGGTNETVKHGEAIKMEDPIHSSASGSKCCDTSYYHEPGKQPCHNQMSSNSITESERRLFSATTTSVNAFMPGNELRTGSQPAGQEDVQQRSTRISSTDGSVKADCKNDHGATCGTESPQTGRDHISNPGSSTPEPIFKPPNMSSQPNKSSGLSLSQKAVAVVPPLSTQSWDTADADESGSISHTQTDAPCKILNVRSLSAESAAALFDFKVTEAAFESLLKNIGNNEKGPLNIQSVASSTVSLSPEPTELVMPYRQMMPQTSDSTSQVIPSGPDYSATKKFDPQTDSMLPDNPASTPCTKDLNHSSMHLPELDTQTGVAIHENCDRDGDLKKAVFDISTVIVTEWTIADLVKLISILHKAESTPEQEMDVKKTVELYGLQGYDDLPDVFNSDLYQSIMAEASSVCREGDNFAVLSQIHHTSFEAVADNFQILPHSPVLPSEEELEVVKSNQAEKGKTDGTAAATHKSNRDTLLSPTRLQSDSAAVVGSVDAFSSIRITVLSPENARKIFGGAEMEVVKLEDPQSALPAPEGQGDEMSLMEVDPYRGQQQEEENQCKSKLGQGVEGESKLDVSSTEMAKGEPVELMETSVEGHCFPADKKTIPVHETKIAKKDQPVENLPDVDQSIENKAPPVLEYPRPKPADDSIQEEGNSTGGEAAVSSGELDEARGIPGPSDSSSSEIFFDTDLSLHEVVIPVQNDTEDENNTNSNYEEALKMAAAVSEQLWKEGIANGEVPVPMQADVDQVPDSGLKADDEVALGNASVDSLGDVTSLPGSIDFLDLERWIGSKTSLSLRQRLHKRISSTEDDHKDENSRRRGKECKRKHSEKSPCSKTPVQEALPQSAKVRKMTEAATVIQTTVHEDHNRVKPLQAKCKDHCSSASMKSKLRKLLKDTYSSQGSNFEKSAAVHKGNPSKELPEQKADVVGKVCLKLYGSSSKAGKMAVSTSGESVFKSHGGRILPAPTMVGLSFHAKDSNNSEASIKGQAKQQVFADWESSFVPIFHSKRYKTAIAKQRRLKGFGNLGVARKLTANPNVCGNESRSSRVQCQPQSSAQSTVYVREGIKHLSKREEKRNMTKKAGENHRMPQENSSVPKTSNKPLGNIQEKKSPVLKLTNKHLGKILEKIKFVPKASNKLLRKIHEKESPVPKPANMLLGKIQEKNKIVPKTSDKHLGKIQEKKSSVPKPANKHLDMSQEKKRSAAKLAENKFVSHLFVQQSQAFPSLRMTAREKRQQDLKKASLSSQKMQAILDKTNRPKNEKFKNMKPVHPLGGPQSDTSKKQKNKTKNKAPTGRSDQITVRGKADVSLPQSFQLKKGPGHVKSPNS